MKKRILSLVAVLALLLSACGGSPGSAMAEELSGKYDFYEKSAENIKKGFDVSADDADQIFLALVECGISSEMGYITKNSDGSFKVYASGTDYTVSIDGNAVSSVFLGKDQLYPEFIPHNDLMDYELTVKDVLNGSPAAAASLTAMPTTFAMPSLVAFTIPVSLDITRSCRAIAPPAVPVSGTAGNSPA